MPEELPVKFAELKAAHDACQEQRREDRATLESIHTKLDEIRGQLQKVPWKVLVGNGVPPIDIRMDRVERDLRRILWVTSAAVLTILADVIPRIVRLVEGAPK